MPGLIGLGDEFASVFAHSLDDLIVNGLEIEPELRVDFERTGDCVRCLLGDVLSLVEDGVDEYLGLFHEERQLIRRDAAGGDFLAQKLAGMKCAVGTEVFGQVNHADLSPPER